jgi:DNA-binding transcriptional ArsR family regulator
MPDSLKFTRIPKVSQMVAQGVPVEVIPTYCALADYSNNKNGLCWPRMDTLARTLGRSVRTVQRHLHELRRLGLVEFIERKRSKRGRFSSWLYRVVLIASFSKAATTGHKKPVAKGGPMFPGTKRSRTTPLTPQLSKEEAAKRRREGYEWLFR